MSGSKSPPPTQPRLGPAWDWRSSQFISVPHEQQNKNSTNNFRSSSDEISGSDVRCSPSIPLRLVYVDKYESPYLCATSIEAQSLFLASSSFSSSSSAPLIRLSVELDGSILKEGLRSLRQEDQRSFPGRILNLHDFCKVLASFHSGCVLHLNLPNNFLDDEACSMLSASICHFTCLETFGLTGNKFSPAGLQCFLNTPTLFRSLTSLQLSFLWLGNEGCATLSEFIKQDYLPRLSTLQFAGNKVTDEGFLLLSDALSKHCPLLKTLNLRANKLCVLPSSMASMHSLRCLNLSNNQIVLLPTFFSRLTLTSITLDGNHSLISPPYSLITNARGAEKSWVLISSYLRDLASTNQVELKRFKLLILGEPMAGKTTIIRSLANNYECMTEPNERTKLLEMSSISIKHQNDNFLFDAYDFGGQEMFRLPQQLFLGGPRLVVLLALPLDKLTPYEKIRSWVHDVVFRSHGAEVLIIPLFTRGDLVPYVGELIARRKILSKQVEDALEVNLKEYACEIEGKSANDDFGILQRSDAQCRIAVRAGGGLTTQLTTLGLLELQEQLLSSARRHFSQPFDVIPSSWLLFIEEIERLKVSRPSLALLSKNDLWVQVGEKSGFLSVDEMEAALLYTHGIGMVLYFPFKASLKSMVFVRPSWLVNVLKMFLRHDLHDLMTLDVSKTPYTHGSFSFAQDVSDLLHSGKLYHRLLPALLYLRIAELRSELLALTIPPPIVYEECDPFSTATEDTSHPAPLPPVRTTRLHTFNSTRDLHLPPLDGKLGRSLQHEELPPQRTMTLNLKSASMQQYLPNANIRPNSELLVRDVLFDVSSGDPIFMSQEDLRLSWLKASPGDDDQRKLNKKVAFDNLQQPPINLRQANSRSLPDLSASSSSSSTSPPSLSSSSKKEGGKATLFSGLKKRAQRIFNGSNSSSKKDQGLQLHSQASAISIAVDESEEDIFHHPTHMVADLPNSLPSSINVPYETASLRAPKSKTRFALPNFLLRKAKSVEHQNSGEDEQLPSDLVIRERRKLESLRRKMEGTEYDVSYDDFVTATLNQEMDFSHVMQALSLENENDDE